MKVLLTTLNSKYSHVNIAQYYLRKCIEDICDVEILHFTINDELNNILESILATQADVVCFGCYIWNIEQTMKLCKNIKKIKPDIVIGLGGPEVSYNPDEVLQNNPFISSVMCGEGEKAIRQLVLDIQNSSLKKIYCIPVTTDEIPHIASDIVDNYDNRVVYLETSRGCPYRCSYCLSCIDKSIKYFDMSKVKEDLKQLLNKNVKQIRFIDRTFNSDRKRALELWKFMIKNRKDTTFHFEICVNLIDEETLSFLATVPKNVFQFEIGVQSTHKETLIAINRGYKWGHEKEMLKELNKLGNIKLHTDLIIGLPYETLDIFKNSFNELFSLHTDEIQLGFLKLLKGTTIYDSVYDFEYIFTEEPPYEVLQNKFISYEEIRFLKKFETIFELYYNSGFFQYTMKLLEELYESPYELFERITNYYIEHSLFDRKVSTDESFTILNDIFKVHTKHIIINQALTYDYFLKFNGSREWHYTKYTDDLKDMIQCFVEENREKLFDNKRNTDVHKLFKFIALDYDFGENKISKKHIYYTKKVK
ncbi:MAG: DUF4080 domain-containing protein [Clostridia bacterium]|nr:DUF4080 domain-containing protein [Clostridia bacterium]